MRSAVSRLHHKGILVRRPEDGRAGYELSETAHETFAEGDRRIYDATEPADLNDGWVTVIFSIPERMRARRHHLRSRLLVLGFGNLSAGVWLAPRRSAPHAAATVERCGLTEYVNIFEGHHTAFGSPRELVRSCWDVHDISQQYADFVARTQPVLKEWQRRSNWDDRQAFVTYMEILQEWRALACLDPGLPVELLPDSWAGQDAASLFRGAADLLGPAAKRHVKLTAF